MSLLTVKDLYKTFKIPQAEDIKVLQGISLDVDPGEFIAIMGPSGSGKSTLLNIIGSIEEYEDGLVSIDNLNLKITNPVETRRAKTSIIYQDFNLLPYLSALENVMIPFMLSGGNEILAREKAEILLERVGLKHRMNHLPDDLSGGEQQRVAIARAMINDPKILLADEPTGNLDSKTGSSIINLFKEIISEKNLSVILVTHDVGIAQKTDRILILREGQLFREEDVWEAI